MPRGLGGEGLRKAVHVGAGAPAFLLRYLEPWQAMVLAALGVAFNAKALPWLTARRLERPEDRELGYSPGILLYPASVLFLLLLFPHRLEIVAAAWGVLAFGDGMGTVAGKWIGGPRLPWNPGKTVAGSSAFLLFGTLGATLLFLFVRGGGSRGPVSWEGALALCFVAAAVCALVEGLPLGIDDNLVVPLMAAGLLYCLSLVDVGSLRGEGGRLLAGAGAGTALNGLLAWAFLRRGWVDRSGAAAGIGIGTLVFTFGGWRGYSVLLLFFALGTASTRVGYRRKDLLGVAQAGGGARSARHAVANCGLAAFLFLVAAMTPYRGMFLLAAVAALATAAFDTVSSEIGQLSPWGTVLPTTLRRVPPGTEGAVSPVGTGAGFLAACSVAGAALGLSLLEGPPAALVVVAAAAVGGTLESLLGATREGARLLDNETANFLNTLFGALAAVVAARWIL